MTRRNPQELPGTPAAVVAPIHDSSPAMAMGLMRKGPSTFARLHFSSLVDEVLLHPPAQRTDG